MANTTITIQDKNQLIIDRCLRLYALDKSTGDVKFMSKEVEDFQQSTVVSDSVTITSADGSTVATLEKGKSGTLSGNMSFVNFALMAAQNGTEVQNASADATIEVPRYEEITIKAGETEATLEYTAIGDTGEEIGYIYLLADDGSLSTTKYEQSTVTGDSAFTYDSGTITVASSDEDRKFAVMYTYESETAKLIENNADEFGGTYRVLADVLCRSICNPDEVIVVTTEAPSAKLTSAYDLSWTSDQKHPFEFTVNADYCNADSKRLFNTYVHEE